MCSYYYCGGDHSVEYSCREQVFVFAEKIDEDEHDRGESECADHIARCDSHGDQYAAQGDDSDRRVGAVPGSHRQRRNAYTQSGT